MSLKIIVIDSFTLNPGDLSWQWLSEFGEVTVYERTEEEKVIPRCKGADIVLTNKVCFSRRVLEQLPGLRFIGVTATGYDIIDTGAARELGITVCNVPGYSTWSVAQHTFALILELTNQVAVNSQSVRNGEWYEAPDFCYTHAPLTELKDKVLGIVGFGNIGQQTAKIGAAFGMEVIYFSPRRKETELAGYVSLKELFKKSDVVSLHLPLKADNREFVNKDLLASMKRTAFLVNTSRGGLINEKDLAEALNAGIIAGAALDVLSVEPPEHDNPLPRAKNCIITPHNAWMTLEARQRVIDITCDSLKGFVDGRPVNVVN